MKVFVAGGSGAVGRSLVSQLAAAGHAVVATSRSQRNATRLRALGAEPMIVDGLDRDGMRDAVASAEPDAVIHEMSALAGKSDLRHFDRWFALTNQLRTRGTDYLIDAAQKAGVSRLIAQSYTGWSNQREGGTVKTEEDPLDADPPAAQRETLAGIRYLETAVTEASGLALRYGSLYGPGTSTSSEFPELLRKRRMPLVGDGSGVWSWIHVDDAASATVAALDRGEPGAYNVVDDEPAPAAEWLPYLAATLGAKPPRHLPVWLARPAAGNVVVSMMTRIRGSSNEKAKRELAWEPRWRSWRDGFRDGLEVGSR